MATIIVATRGEYSDFCVEGVFDIRKPFTFAKVIEELRVHLTLEGREVGDRPPRPEELAAYLQKAGYVTVADYQEVHLGAYGGIEIAEPDREWTP